LRNHILDLIYHIEKDFSVKVLLACESGSRAWGVSTQTSDYDIRFLYIHHFDWYLSIDTKRDVIEIPKMDSISMPVHPQIDITGWEITKALRLFRKSNPPLLEWIHSNTVYYNAYKTLEKMNEMSGSIFSPMVCMLHYLNMAKSNFKDIQKEKEMNVKLYLNVIRPLLSAKWLGKYNAFPPNEYYSLLEGLCLEEKFEYQIKQLMNLKMLGVTQQVPIQLEEVNQYIVAELDILESIVKGLSNKQEDPTPLLDHYFREMLKVVWGSV
jgi:uncharacterized protein